MLAIASIATSMPFPGPMRPKVASTISESASWSSNSQFDPQGRRSRRLTSPEAPDASRSGPPWGTMRTLASSTTLASTIMFRAVSVNTVTSVAFSARALAIEDWLADGMERTVWNVTTNGWPSSSASVST